MNESSVSFLSWLLIIFRSSRFNAFTCSSSPVSLAFSFSSCIILSVISASFSVTASWLYLSGFTLVFWNSIKVLTSLMASQSAAIFFSTVNRNWASFISFCSWWLLLVLFLTFSGLCILCLDFFKFWPHRIY